MAPKSNYPIIGAFVLGALLILLGGLFMAGRGALRSDMDQYVLFFKGSLKGLSKGSPVLLRGVRIGNVYDIKVLYYKDAASLSIPVIVEIDKRAVTQGDDKRTRTGADLWQDPKKKGGDTGGTGSSRAAWH